MQGRVVILISRAYLHLAGRPGDSLENLARLALEIAEASGREFFPNDPVQAEARVEEGSRKIWVWVFGAATLFLSRYGDIRSGAEYLYKDGRRVAAFISDQIVNALGKERPRVIRRGRSGGVPESLVRLFQKADEGEISRDAAIEKTRRLLLRHDVPEEIVDSAIAEFDKIGNADSVVQKHSVGAHMDHAPARVPDEGKPPRHLLREPPSTAHPTRPRRGVTIRRRHDGSAELEWY